MFGRGIPNGMFIPMRKAMLELDIFDSQEKMMKLFEECRNLRPWKYQIPWTNSRMSRVQGIIALLVDKKLVTGEEPLTAFMEQLVEKYKDDPNVEQSVTSLRQILSEVKAAEASAERFILEV